MVASRNEIRSLLLPTLIASGLCVLASPSHAVDTTVLFKKGDWRVQHEYYPDTSGEACAARTQNNSSDTFDVTLWQNGDHTVWIFMDQAPWSGEFSDDVKLHIDNEHWTLQNAEFEDETVQFQFSDTDNLFTFLDDLRQSNAMALKTPDERNTITAWSLNGSSAAVAQLFECFEKISSTSADSQYGTGARYGE